VRASAIFASRRNEAGPWFVGFGRTRDRSERERTDSCEVQRRPNPIAARRPVGRRPGAGASTSCSASARLVHAGGRSLRGQWGALRRSPCAHRAPETARGGFSPSAQGTQDAAAGTPSSAPRSDTVGTPSRCEFRATSRTRDALRREKGRGAEQAGRDGESAVGQCLGQLDYLPEEIPGIADPSRGGGASTKALTN
jgi:hypothetical protein